MKKLFFLSLFVFLFAFGMNAQYNLFPEVTGERGDIAIGDVDNDGDLDIIFAGETRFDPRFYKGGLYINNGQGSFTRKDDFPVMPGWRASIDLGDIDGDGDLDIIFSGHKNQDVIEKNARGIALNDGQGNFAIANIADYPHLEMHCPSVIFADFNNDGLLDYFNAPHDEREYWDWETGENIMYAGNWTFYFQQPDGSFVPDGTPFRNYFTDPVITAGDFDNDGDVDLFYQGFIKPSSAVSETFPELTADRWTTVLFANDGTGHFSVGYDFGSSGLGNCDWGDLDGDGDLDVIFNGDGHYMGLWLGAVYNRICLNEDTYFTELPALDRAGQFDMQGGDVLQDLNNDGKVDVLFGGWNADIGFQKTYVYDNIHTGGDFIYETSLQYNTYLTDSYIPGMSEQDFECADLNGDNVVDFVYMGFKGVNSFTTDAWGNDVNIAAWTPGLSEHAAAYTKLNAPRNLSATKTAVDGKWQVTFSWDEPDNIGTKKSVTYNLALKNATTGKWLYYPNAIVGGEKDGFHQVNRMGNVYLNKQWTLTLPEGNYQWTVQAIDPARFGGSFAPMQSLATTDIKELSLNGLTITSSKGNLVVTDNNGGLLNLKVYTVSGQTVLDTPFSGYIAAPLQKGVYVVKVSGKQGSKTEKVVIK